MVKKTFSLSKKSKPEQDITKLLETIGFTADELNTFISNEAEADKKYAKLQKNHPNITHYKTINYDLTKDKIDTIIGLRISDPEAFDKLVKYYVKNTENVELNATLEI